jgi:hypothetical protein
LEPVAEIFKQHVEGEGQKLVKAVTEEIESKKEKDTGGGWQGGGCFCAVVRSVHYRQGQCGFSIHSWLGWLQECHDHVKSIMLVTEASICLPPPLPAAKAGPSKDSGTQAEQQFVRSLLELHDKYLGYVSTCFANASLFHKSLKVHGLAGARVQAAEHEVRSAA